MPRPAPWSGGVGAPGRRRHAGNFESADESWISNGSLSIRLTRAQLLDGCCPTPRLNADLMRYGGTCLRGHRASWDVAQTIQDQRGAPSDWSVTGSRPANFAEPVQRRKARRASRPCQPPCSAGMHVLMYIICQSPIRSRNRPSGPKAERTCMACVASEPPHHGDRQRFVIT